MIADESAAGRARLCQGDRRDLSPVPTASVGVMLTPPPDGVSDRGRAAADRYAQRLMSGFDGLITGRRLKMVRSCR